MASQVGEKEVMVAVSSNNGQEGGEGEGERGLRLVATYLWESMRQSLSNSRPWGEVLDRSALSKPASFSEATIRIRHNISYFRVNYYVLVSIILALSLLSNPFSLFLLIALLASWLFLYLLRPSHHPLRLFSRTFSDFDTLSLLSSTTFILLFFTSLGSLLLTSFTLSLALVASHASLRLPEDLFLDHLDTSQPPGLLPILRSAFAVPPPAAPPSPLRR